MTRHTSSPAWLAGASLVALISPPAQAQEIRLAAATALPAPAAAAPVPASEPAPEPVSADAAAPSGGEIVVTARRREERAQDVPIALSVISERTLAASGDYTLGQVQQLVPSLFVSGGNARNTNINIRGLGSNAITNDGLENGVGFYVDDVYYGRVGQSQFDLVDLDRIEVLRGPQGTLFGKNTTAGAISVTTRAPSFDWQFSGEGSLGDYNYHQVRGSFSGPIATDLAAFRLSIADTHRDGFIHNLHNDRWGQDYDNFTARGQVLVTPAPGVTIRLIGDYSRQRQYASLNSLVGFFGTYTNGTVIKNSFLDRVARFGYVPVFDPFARTTDVDADVHANMESYGLSGRVDWSLGGVTLTSISAYRWWDWYPSNDSDNTPLQVGELKGTGTINHQRQFSEELRLSSNGDNKVDWVAGLYYFYQQIKGYGFYGFAKDAALFNYPTSDPHVTDVALNGFESDSWLIPTTKSYAAFGQATWKITDRLKLTGGLRFTHEDKNGLFDEFTVAGQDLSLLSPADRATAQALRDTLYPAVDYTVSLSNDSLSGMANLSYQLAHDVQVYATFSRGAKSGGLSLGVLPAGVSAAVRPETVNAYELGFKSQFWNRRVTLNLAAYWDDVTDYQAAITQQVGQTNASIRYIANIPSVRSRGIEGDLTIAPSPWLSFTASAAYNDATYRDYKNAPLSPEQSYTRPNPPLASDPPYQDLSGQPLAGAPKFTYTLGADASRPLGHEIELYGHADYAHRSSYFSSATNSIYSLIPAYGILNARLGLRLANDRWDISVWAKNLTDTHYYTSLGGANTGLITGLLGDPRTFGATLRVKF